MINRGTVSTKIDRVLTITVVPRGSPGFGPGSIRVSSRFRLVCPGSSTVHPGSLSVQLGSSWWHPSSPLWCLGSPWCHHGYTTVFVGIENVSNSFELGRHRDEAGWHRGEPGLTVAKLLRPVCPVASRFTPVASWFTPVPSLLPTVCARSSRFITIESWCYHGLSRLHCSLAWFLRCLSPLPPVVLNILI